MTDTAHNNTQREEVALELLTNGGTAEPVVELTEDEELLALHQQLNDNPFAHKYYSRWFNAFQPLGDLQPPEPPVVCQTDDGKALFTLGSLSEVVGEKRAGKSLLLTMATLQEIRDGYSVFWLDSDDGSARRTLDRLRKFAPHHGVSEDQLQAQFLYATPAGGFWFGDTSQAPLGLIAIRERIRVWNESGNPPVRMFVIDSVTPQLQYDNFTSNSQETRRWYDAVREHLANGLNLAVPVIDHTGHSSNNRSTGTAQKAAGSTVSYMVKNGTNRNRVVRFEVECSTSHKDGWWTSGESIGNFYADMRGDAWEVTFQSTSTTPLDNLLRRISDYAEKHADEVGDKGWSLSQLRQKITGGNQDKGDAIRVAATTGILELRNGNYHFVRPYDASTDSQGE